MAAPEKSHLFDTLRRFFEEDDWPVVPSESTPSLFMNFEGKNGQWRAVAQAREIEGQVLYYTICPVAVPVEKRAAVMEYLTRANYGLFVGNFEMDLSDGEIRYKTSVGLEDGVLTMEMCRSLVYVNNLMMDRYMPGIIAVVAGAKSALQAVEAIEQPELLQ